MARLKFRIQPLQVHRPGFDLLRGKAAGVAQDDETVARWHEAGKANGGTCDGEPGPRERAPNNSVGAYLRDQAANVFIAHINEPYAASRKIGEWTITSSNALNFEGIQPALETAT